MSEQDEPRIAMCKQCNGEGYFYGDEVPVLCSTSDAVTQLAMHQTAQIAELIAERDALRADRQILAEAICGGEDFPGLMAGTSSEDLAEIARTAHANHAETINALIKAQSDILASWRSGFIFGSREVNKAVVDEALHRYCSDFPGSPEARAAKSTNIPEGWAGE